MPRPDRVTRLINTFGALQRLSEAIFWDDDERLINALKVHLNEARKDLTLSDIDRIHDASFEALMAGKRQVKAWERRDEEARHINIEYTTAPPVASCPTGHPSNNRQKGH